MTLFNFLKNDSEGESKSEAYIFMGRSGCGKGTQVELFKKAIEEKTGAQTLHVETGAFFRQFIKGETFTQKLTAQIVNSGGLMPESLAMNMWVNFLNDNYTGKENLLFDGAPRKIREAEALHDTLKFYGLHGYKVIYIHVSSEWSKEKLLARGRIDDTESGVAKRIAWFDKDVMPSIEFFRANRDGCTFVEINGEQTVEKVHEEIMAKIAEC